MTPQFENILRSLEEYSLPPIIILDITNACNLRCVHCPHSDSMSRADFKPSHMEWRHFANTLAELEHHRQPCLLRVVGDGEPLLHPRLMEMLAYAKEHSSCIVNLTTNGTLMTSKKAEEILKIGIDLIDVSIDALTKPTYEAVRRGGSYEGLMLNMFSLLETRKRLNASTKIMFSFIEQNENSHETEWFKKFWNPLVDYTMVRTLHSASGQVKLEESRTRNKVEERSRYACPHLWKRLTVDFLGRIKFCAQNWEADCVLGNIEDSSLGSIWNGDRLAKLRAQHLSGKLTDDSICRDCSDWASSSWDWGYERLVDRVVMGKPTFIPCLPPLSADPVP